jgi:hypothetical protein
MNILSAWISANIAGIFKLPYTEPSPKCDIQNVQLRTKDSLEGLMLQFPNCAEAERCALFQNIAFFFQFMCIILSNSYYAVRT